MKIMAYFICQECKQQLWDPRVQVKKRYCKMCGRKVTQRNIRARKKQLLSKLPVPTQISEILASSQAV